MRTITLTLGVTAMLATVLSERPTHAMEGGDIVDTLERGRTAQVRLMNGTNSLCSGTLIDPSWVLTAEHCLAPMDRFFHEGTEYSYRPTIHYASAIESAIWDGSTSRWIVAGWRSFRQVTHPDVIDTRRTVSIAALNRFGEIDTTFGASPIAKDQPGFVSTRLSGMTGSQAVAVLRHPLGQDLVVVTNARAIDDTDHVGVIRYSPSGIVVAASWPTPATPSATLAYAPAAGTARAARFTTNGLIVAGSDGKRWLAMRYTASGSRDTSFAPFGQSDFDGGGITDVVEVGDHLVWLGSHGGEHRLVVTNQAGQLVKNELIDEASVLLPERLIATNDGAVWVIGSNGAGPRGQKYSLPTLAPAAALSTGVTFDAFTFAAATADPVGRIVVAGVAGKELVTARFVASAGSLDATYFRNGVSEMGIDAASLKSIAFHPDDGTYLVAGTDERLKDGLLIGLTTAADELPQLAVHVDGVPNPDPPKAERIVRHATLDIGLVKLDRPIPIVFPGVAAVAVEQSVRCYGYGGHDGEDDEPEPWQLRAADFTVVDTPTDVLDIWSASAAMQHGDSGGACFEQGANGRLVAVNRSIVPTDDPSRTGNLGHIVPVTSVAAWIYLHTHLEAFQ